jgi:hypothetical protein
MSPNRTDSVEDPPRRRRRRQVTNAEIIDLLEYLAPPAQASPATPYGLQVGAAQSAVKSIVITPLLSAQAISCATAFHAELIISAAPLLSTPLETLRWDNPIGARAALLAQKQISLYVLANSYAAVPGGFDDSLAEQLGLAPTGVLAPTVAEKQLKFVVFVPPRDLEKVQNAAAEAGAGLIGNYSNCAFRTPGTGTFLGRPGSNPTVGRPGRLEHADEVRLEMLVPERDLKGVVAAVLQAHSYEEVAYDVYPLRNPGPSYGRGRIGELPLQVSLDTVLAQVNDALGLNEDKRARCVHRPGLPIASLAVASGMGAGENLLWHAHRREAGAIVLGGLSPVDLMLVDNASTAVIDIGFAASVAPGLQRLLAQIRDTFEGDGIQVAYASSPAPAGASPPASPMREDRSAYEAL